MTRKEAAEIAYLLVIRHEAQNTKILLVADALKAAYDRGILDGVQRESGKLHRRME